jgi:hypothetical protein
MKLMIWTTLIMCISSMRQQNRNRKLNNNISFTKRERSVIGFANSKLMLSMIKSTKSLHDFSLVLSSSANLYPFCPLKGTIKSDDIEQLNTELSDTTSNMINGYDMRNIVDKEYDFMEYYEKIYKIKSLLKKKPLFFHPSEEHDRKKISPINIKFENDFDDVEII